MNTRAVPRPFACPSPRGRTRVALLALVAFLLVLGGGVYWMSQSRPKPPATALPPLEQFSFRIMWPDERDFDESVSAAARETLVRACIAALERTPLESVPIGLANTPPPPGTVGVRIRFLRGFDVVRAPEAVHTFIVNKPLRVTEMFLARVPDTGIPGGRGVVWAQTDLGRVLTTAPVALDALIADALTQPAGGRELHPIPVRITVWKPDGRPLAVPAESGAFRSIADAAASLVPLTPRTLDTATASPFSGSGLPPAWMVNPAAVTVAVTYDQALDDPRAEGAADTILLADMKSALPEGNLVAAIGPWTGDVWRAVPVDATAVAQHSPGLHNAVVAALNAKSDDTPPQLFAPANAQLIRSAMSRLRPGVPADSAALAVVIEALWYAVRWMPVEPRIMQMEPTGIQILWNAPVTLSRPAWPKAPIPFTVFRCALWFPDNDATRVVLRFESSNGELTLSTTFGSSAGGAGVRPEVADAIKKLNGD